MYIATEIVISFKTLGSTVSDEVDNEILLQIAQTTAAEADIEWQKQFSLLQDVTNVLPSYPNIPECFWDTNREKKSVPRRWDATVGSKTSL